MLTRIAIGLVLVVVLLAVSVWAATLIQTEYGRLEFEGNELLVVSTNNDPPKVRLRAPARSGYKGCWTADTERRDGGYEEIALICFGQDERYRSDPYNFTGAINIQVRKYDPSIPDDQQFKKVIEIAHDGVRFNVPVFYGQKVVPYIRAGAGQYETHQQDDGNLVTYDVLRNPWQAVWASGFVNGVTQ